MLVDYAKASPESLAKLVADGSKELGEISITQRSRVKAILKDMELLEREREEALRDAYHQIQKMKAPELKTFAKVNFKANLSSMTVPDMRQTLKHLIADKLKEYRRDGREE